MFESSFYDLIALLWSNFCMTDLPTTVIVFQDCLTKWPLAYPIPDQKTVQIAKPLVEEVIFFGIPEALLSNWGTNVFSCLMWVTKNEETEHNGLPSPVHLWFSVDRHHVYMAISAVKQCKCIVNVTTQKNNCLFTGINVGRLSMEAVSIITLLLLSPSYSKLQQKPFVIVKNININILHVICSTKGLGNYLWKSK